MRIITSISIVSSVPMSSSSSPFTYEAVEVIFGIIYFHFDLQTGPNLEDYQYSDNLTTISESSLYILYKRLMTGSSKYFYDIFIFILFRRNGHNFAYLQLLKHNNNKILYLISKYCTHLYVCYAIISQ